jgi:hypothetical protein
VPSKPEWGRGVVRAVDGPLVTVRFFNRGTVVVETRSARLSIVRIMPLITTRPTDDGKPRQAALGRD